MDCTLAVGYGGMKAEVLPIDRMKIASIFFTLLVMLWPRISWASELPFRIGNFSQADLTGWQEKIFERQTEYTLVAIDAKTAVKATSQQAASGLFKEVRIDLEKTPFLNWSWKIEQGLPPHDETTKAGDDFAARIYLVIKTGSWFWNLIAINYVWSPHSPLESRWLSATTTKACMIVAGNASEQPAQWSHEKRDVRRDFLECFKKEIRYLDAVAIMTDTDNTGGSAVAYYGDIYFSVE